MDSEKDWAILASGPSMSQEVADSVRGLHVIAVSNTYQLAPWADILVSNDNRWWKNYPEALNFTGEKFCGLCIEPPKGVTKFANAISGSNSGLLALMIAVKKGAKRILLFGFDMHGSHYFGEHVPSLKNPDNARFSLFKKQFSAYKPQGVEIINCTPGTALKCYPIGKAEDYLPKPEPEPEPVVEKDLTGPEGPRGPEGPKGERGPRGPQGEQGPIGPMPDHQWSGTSLRFEEPDGTWGKYVDLRGPMGVQGYPGGGGGTGQGMTPLQALQLQTLLDIFGGWIDAAPVASIDEVVIDDLEVSTEGSATGFYPTYPFTTFTPLDAEWEWDWGDGSSSTTQDASHSYAADGTYTIRFRAKNHIGWSDWVEDEVTVAAPSDGVLSITSALTSDPVNISSLGAIAWKIFETTDGVASQSMLGGGSQIGDVEIFPIGDGGSSSGSMVDLSWTDGTPTLSGSTTAAIFRTSIDNTRGYQIPVDASTTEYVLRVGTGAYNGTVMVDASLGDTSAAPIVGYESSIVGTSGAQLNGYVDIRFKATSATDLTFRLWVDGSTSPFSSAVTIQYMVLLPG